MSSFHSTPLQCMRGSRLHFFVWLCAYKSSLWCSRFHFFEWLCAYNSIPLQCYVRLEVPFPCMVMRVQQHYTSRSVCDARGVISLNCYALIIAFHFSVMRGSRFHFLVWLCAYNSIIQCMRGSGLHFFVWLCAYNSIPLQCYARLCFSLYGNVMRL